MLTHFRSNLYSFCIVTVEMLINASVPFGISGRRVVGAQRLMKFSVDQLSVCLLWWQLFLWIGVFSAHCCVGVQNGRNWLMFMLSLRQENAFPVWGLSSITHPWIFLIKEKTKCPILSNLWRYSSNIGMIWAHTLASGHYTNTLCLTIPANPPA